MKPRGRLILFVWAFALPFFAHAATLTLTLPQTTDEGAGAISGTVSMDVPASEDTDVALISDNPSGIAGKSVTIPAGKNTMQFQLVVEDDRLLDGVQTVVMTARAAGCTDARAPVFILDNETTELSLDIPDGLIEGQGMLTNSGTVALAGIAVHDMHILLTCSDATEVEVPRLVTIPAGESNAVFNIGVVDDSETDGRQSSTITASFPGFVQASEVLAIGDNEFDSFAISGPEGDMPGNVPLLVTVEATSIDGHVVAGYSGAVDLSVRSASSASLQIEPSDRIELINGRWQGAVTIQQSEDTNVQLVASDRVGHSGLSAPFNLFTLNVRKMVTDWTLPCIYIIHRDPDPFASWRLKPGSKLLWYNTAFNAVERVVNPGDDVTDMAVHYGEDRIYVNNWGHEETRVFDRMTKAPLDPLYLGTDVYHIKAGQPGCVYTAEYNWISYLHAFSTTNGNELARSSSWVYSGVAESTSDGRYLYMCSTRGSTEKVVKYDISGNTFSWVDTLIPGTDLNNMVVSMDGKYVYCNQAVYDDNFNEIRSFGSEIYAASAYGDLAVSESRIYNGHTGKELYTLPFESRYTAFSGDQKTLLIFNSNDGALTNLNTSGIQPIPEPSIIPSPADGQSVGINLPGLEWTAAPLTTGYDIYFGTNSTAVAEANTDSTQYIGRLVNTDYPFPEAYISSSENYFWRVDAVTYGGIVSTGTVWNFKTAAITTEPYELTLDGLAASYTQTVNVAIDSAADAPTEWTASCLNDWVILESSTGSAPGMLTISFNMTGLPAGIHTAEIVLHDGSTSLSLPVTLDVEPMQLVRMATDWALPYIYMLHTSDRVSNKSSLIWYNTDTDQIEQVLDAGLNGTDLTVHYGDNRIYVCNFEQPETRVFDRTSRQELEPLLLSSNADRVTAGRAGRIYTVRNDFSDYSEIWNSVTGERLASYYASQADGECSPDGKFYYQVHNASAPRFSKFDVTGDSFELVSDSFKSDAGIYGLRELILSGAGNRIYYYKGAYNIDFDRLYELDSQIYAASAYGDLVLTETAAYDGASGEEIYSLPFPASVMAFSGDQSRLVLFDSAAGTLSTLDTADIKPIPSLAPIPEPAHGSSVAANLLSLRWSVDPSSIAYDVYLGTYSNEVASATTNSPAFVGRQEGVEVLLSEGLLAGNTPYYWRVDVVRFSSISTGEVWSFETGALTVDPLSLNLSGVVADYTQMVSLAISSAAGDPIDWSASCAADWVILPETNGTTGGQLNVGVNVTSLSAGDYSTDIVLRDGAVSLIVPVAISVVPMRIVRMEADWSEPYIYLINNPEEDSYPSQLIWYNTGNQSIEYVISAGDDARDLAVHYGENRIYVNNYWDPETRVFDRSSREKLDPVLLEEDIDRISASLPGRLTTAGGGAFLWDTESGTKLDGSSGYRDGGGICTLDGGIYYHCESGTSGAQLHKFVVSSNDLNWAKGVRSKFYYGSDNVIVSMDGRRVYNCGTVYDAELNELLDLTNEIFAASAYGDLVCTADAVYDGVDGQIVYNLPLSSEVMALAGDQSLLLLYDDANAALTDIDMSSVMSLPIPSLAPEPVDGGSCSPALQELSWSMGPGALAPGALLYDVYLGTESNSVANADTNGAVYLGQSDSPERQLLEGQLKGWQTYYWRVDMVRPSGEVVRGVVWNFDTISIAVEPQELFVKGLMAADVGPLSVSITNRIEAAVGWTVTSPDEWIILTQTNGVGSGVLSFDVNLSILVPGTHIGRLVFADENGSFEVPVTVEVEALNTITKMATDWELPYIYMIERKDEWPYESRLIWFNTQTKRIEQVLEAGNDVSDLTVHYGDDRIYASSRGDEEVLAYDRMTGEALEPLPLGGSINVITAGNPGRLLLSRGNYGSPEVWDTGTGLQVTNRIDYVYGGDIESSLDGRYCYHVSTSSDAYLSKYFIEGDTYTRVARGSGTGSWASVPILASMDGSRITSQTRIYDADLNTLAALDVSSSYESIFAISAYGELVVSGIGVHNGDTGETLYSLPFQTGGMAFSGDQSSLVVFNSDNRSLTNINTSSIMLLPEPGMEAAMAVGSVQDVAVRELSWSAPPLALGYDVFFGVDSNAVANATTNSSEYIGSSLSENIMVPTERMTGNETYYWRVEARSYRNQVTRSAVWNFQTASISVAPQRLLVDGVVASYTQRVDVAIGSAVGTPVDWVASCTNEWVTLGTTNGITGESLDIGFGLSGLEAGSHTAEIEFHAAGKILRLPIELTVVELNIVKMTADWELPYIYMLHRSDNISRQSLLLWYDTDLGSIEHVVDSGTYALDFTVHYGEEKIYVGNYDRDTARVFGRISRDELDPFPLEQGVQSICAGAPGRILTDRGGALRIWDTSNGTNLAFIGTSDGDGECSPDGRYYYHSQDNISYGKLQKYDVSGDTFELMTNVTMSSWRSWNNLVSKDGLRVTKGRVVYDADLNEILRLTDETYAASPYADAVVTESAVYDVSSGNHLLALPFSTKISAFSADQTSLVMYNATGHSISVLDTSGVLPPLGSDQPESVSAYMAWQLEYSLDDAMAAEADDDLDGQSNLDEYIAGTDPTSKDSCFVVHAVELLPNGQVVIRWDSVEGREYCIYWTPSLTNGFSLLESEIHHPQNSYTDQVERAEQSGFYKVSVELEQ